jgi:hypothetical protein
MHRQATDQQGCTAALPTTLGGTYCFFIASVSFLQVSDPVNRNYWQVLAPWVNDGVVAAASLL